MRSRWTSSPLVDLESTIHVRDLVVDGKLTVVNDPDDLVAKVTPPREEEVIEPVVVEGEGEEAAEGDEGAEGEGAGEGAASTEEGDES